MDSDFVPFSVPPIGSQGIESNAGIALSIEGGRYRLQARYREDLQPQHIFPPFNLPRIPAKLIEDCARLLRSTWTRSARCGGWLLYLDMVHHTWYPFLPPQFISPETMRMDVTFPRCHVPRADLRLAGSLLCTSDELALQLVDQLPVFDGIHIYLHADNWLRLTSFVIVGGEPHTVPPTKLLIDPPLDDQKDLHERLWIVDSL